MAGTGNPSRDIFLVETRSDSRQTNDLEFEWRFGAVMQTKRIPGQARYATSLRTMTTASPLCLHMPFWFHPLKAHPRHYLVGDA